MSEMILFGAPFWFAIGAMAIALLLFLYREIGRRRQKALQVFAAPHLLESSAVMFPPIGV